MASQLATRRVSVEPLSLDSPDRTIAARKKGSTKWIFFAITWQVFFWLLYLKRSIVYYCNTKTRKQTRRFPPSSIWNNQENKSTFFQAMHIEIRSLIENQYMLSFKQKCTVEVIGTVIDNDSCSFFDNCLQESLKKFSAVKGAARKIPVGATRMLRLIRPDAMARRR